DAIEELLDFSGSENAKGYRVKELKGSVSNDRALFANFYQKASRVKQSEDPKLAALLEEGLKRILKSAKAESKNEDEFRLKRKVIIFTYYSDTVDWIFDYLQERFDEDLRFKPYRGRLIAVKGDESSAGFDREEAVFRFAP